MKTTCKIILSRFFSHSQELDKFKAVKIVLPIKSNALNQFGNSKHLCTNEEQLLQQSLRFCQKIFLKKKDCVLNYLVNFV